VGEQNLGAAEYAFTVDGGGCQELNHRRDELVARD
jgi:hypothetical protein